MKNKYFILILYIFLASSAYSEPFEYHQASNGFKYVYHRHSESSFQHAHCSNLEGIEEFELSDRTRVDCLTRDYAIEYDFANKKYEAIVQALHYGVMTNKIPKIVLILDKNKQEEQLVYYNRIKRIGEIYRFEVEYITEDILNCDKNGKCKYQDCKCHRHK